MTKIPSSTNDSFADLPLTTITALSPLDGRYATKTAKLRPLFSEFGLMRYRILIEIKWLQVLQPQLSSAAKQSLEKLYIHFNESDATRIKNIESSTNHDVKAVEYFIKEKIAANSELAAVSEWVHFACTSEDINNLAYGTILHTARQQIILPYLGLIKDILSQFAHHYANQAMLARTHGQSATPTTVGKEFANVIARLLRQQQLLTEIKINGKINGAVGNFNAHVIADPTKNWEKLAEIFVKSLGLTWNRYTTQIEPHDYLAELTHNLIRINIILIDFCRDIWGYISLGYFRQKSLAHEVGSSTMPHKINPIDFENAEGNFYLANAVLNCLAEKLPLSRWQRDLVDSTLLRNLGVAFGHCVVAYETLLKGLKKLEINPQTIAADLNNAWEVLAEPIQTVMRAHGIEQSYEKLKALTRGKKVITQQMLHDFIDELALPTEIKDQLKNLTPETYVGYAEKLAREI